MAIEDSTPAPPANPEPAISLNPTPPTTFAPHRMKVGYIGPSTPYLRLQGHWLEQAGFPVGTPVRVEVSERRLIVEAVEPRGTPSLCRAQLPARNKEQTAMARQIAGVTSHFRS
jgi:hypothetical protein